MRTSKPRLPALGVTGGVMKKTAGRTVRETIDRLRDIVVGSEVRVPASFKLMPGSEGCYRRGGGR